MISQEKINYQFNEWTIAPTCPVVTRYSYISSDGNIVQKKREFEEKYYCTHGYPVAN